MLIWTFCVLGKQFSCITLFQQKSNLFVQKEHLSNPYNKGHDAKRLGSHRLDFMRTVITHYYFVKLTALNYQDSTPKKIGSYLSSESTQYTNVPWGLLTTQQCNCRRKIGVKYYYESPFSMLYTWFGGCSAWTECNELKSSCAIGRVKVRSLLLLQCSYLLLSLPVWLQIILSKNDASEAS